MKKIIIGLLLVILSLGAGSAFAAQSKKAVNDTIVKLETNMGDIVVRLDSKRAPRTAANFIQYVKSGHYDGTIFHRVIKDFMIQGGGFSKEMKEKRALAPIRNEANNGLKNKKYTIAMARTSDPHSASAQFFINTKDNDFLDFKSETPEGWGYAVFGQVIQGQDVVDKIEAAKTGSRGYMDDVPLTPLIIKKAVVLEGN